MKDKTNVTNAGVNSESPETVETPSEQGHASSTSTDGRGVSWENRAKEAERKFAALADKYESTEGRLNELEGMVRLSQTQQAEKERLTDRRDDLKDQISQLRSRPDAQPWLGAAKEEAMTAAEQVLWNRELRSQKRFLESKAKENGLDYNKFVKEIAVFEGRYSEEYPLDRAEACYGDWLKLKDLEKRESKLKDEEAKAQGFKEGDGRTIRDKNPVTSIHEVKSESDLQDVADNIFSNMDKYYKK